MKIKMVFTLRLHESFFRISRKELFWSLFNFRNKFIKQFALNKDHFFNFGLKIFLEQKSNFLQISDFNK